MDNFNAVFLAVKKYCGEMGITGDANCFHAISEELAVTPDHLDGYLEILQNLGLIRYSTTEVYIKITPFGARQEKLFI